MLRNICNFCSFWTKPKVGETPKVETVPKKGSLLNPQRRAHSTAMLEMSRGIQEDVAQFLSAQTAGKRADLLGVELEKTESDLVADFKMKHADYLQKKKAFKECKNDNSQHYQNLKQAYLAATHAAWSAFSRWSEYGAAVEKNLAQEGNRLGYGNKR